MLMLRFTACPCMWVAAVSAGAEPCCLRSFSEDTLFAIMLQGKDTRPRTASRPQSWLTAPVSHMSQLHCAARLTLPPAVYCPSTQSLGSMVRRQRITLTFSSRMSSALMVMGFSMVTRASTFRV